MQQFYYHYCQHNAESTMALHPRFVPFHTERCGSKISLVLILSWTPSSLLHYTACKLWTHPLRVDWAWQLANQSLNYGEMLRWCESNLSTLYLNQVMCIKDLWFLATWLISDQFYWTFYEKVVNAENKLWLFFYSLMLIWKSDGKTDGSQVSDVFVQWGAGRVYINSSVVERTVIQLFNSMVGILARPQWAKWNLRAGCASKPFYYKTH